MTNRTLADVAEGVRTALASYTQALDDGRTEDVVATFCPDGAIAIPGLGTHTGHDALRQAYAQWAPRRPQRHLVMNTLVRTWSDDEATAVSDVVFLLLGRSGWEIKLVGRYEDTLHRHDASWRFHRRAATFVAETPPGKEAV
jgi:SnoaL-like domain